MKNRIVLLTATLLLLITAGICPAFTLAEHEANVKKYVQAMAKSPEIIKTYCEMDGTVLSDVETMGQYDSVRYLQGVYDSSIELRPVGEIIALTTKNPEFKLPDGSKAGDPIDRVMKAALIPGDYSRQIGNGFALHVWMRDGKFTMIKEENAAISEIAFGNASKMKSVTINDDYNKYLDEIGQPAAPAREEESPNAPLPEADDKLNDSTDAAVINSYPLPQKEKNTLSIQHRGAYKLYSGNKYKDAYAAFSKLADDYENVNYLSAYWAGITALKLNKKDDARSWFERALSINGNYRPAQKELDKLDGKKTAAAAPADSGGTFTSPKDWAKTLSKADYNKAVKIYEMLTTFGANEAEVTKKLGNPTNKYILEDFAETGTAVLYGYGGKKDPTGNDWQHLWNNADLSFSFISDNKVSKIRNMDCMSAKYKFKHINIGDSFDKAVSVFGNNYINNDDIGRSFSYRVALREWNTGEEIVSITFNVENKKIKDIFALHCIEYEEIYD